MDLTKIVLPDSVIVDGRAHSVKTGHPYWFRFASIMDQETKRLSDFDYLYNYEPPINREHGISALIGFYYEHKDIPRSEGEASERVLDYSIDSDLVYSAILQCYGVDLYDKMIHWHKVRAMISGLTGTRLNDVMGYRLASPGKNKELARMKRIWELPEKVSVNDKADLEKMREVFYGAQF